MLRFNQVDKAYSQLVIFAQLNSTICQQKVVISGENGRGKTTLLLIAAGIEPVDQGDILLNQQSVYQPSMRNQIGISASAVALPDFMSPQQLLDFHCQQFACDFPNPLIERFKFTPYLHTQVQDLSLGNLKKLSLLLAMAHSPALLLLDEPTNGLDDNAVEQLLLYLASYSGQVLIASHDPCFIHNTLYHHMPLDSLL